MATIHLEFDVSDLRELINLIALSKFQHDQAMKDAGWEPDGPNSWKRSVNSGWKKTSPHKVPADEVPEDIRAKGDRMVDLKKEEVELSRKVVGLLETMAANCKNKMTLDEFLKMNEPAAKTVSE